MSPDEPIDKFQRTLSDEQSAKLRRWQDNVYDEMRTRSEETVHYLGLTLTIPPSVQPIAGMSDLFGDAILKEVRESDRVLDMGTGCGVNAILAASKSSDVVAVDVNPAAIESAKRNAETNEVGSRVHVLQSDVFQNVSGTFDLMIFDPPFRWFAPRDMFEVSTTDEGYRALQTFFREVPSRLNPGGRILLFFASSGDLGFLKKLIADSGFRSEVLARRGLRKEGLDVEYFSFRLTQTT